jgi:DNA-binding NarL/FixJ family response regulator
MSTTATAIRTPDVPSPCQGFLTDLVLRCGEGDESALGELFDLTYFLVARIVNPGSATSLGAEDRILEAFRRIWQRSPAYQPNQQGVLSWVFDQVRDEHPAAVAPVRPLRVVVQSRNDVARAGLTQLLSSDKDHACVVEPGNAAGFLKSHDVAVYELAADVATLEAELDVLLAGGVPVVAMTQYARSDLAEMAISRGVAEVVQMDIPREGLLQALERAAAGSTTTPVAYRRQRRDAAQAAAHLSNREVTVLELVGRGLSNQDIATELYVSINTVKTYIRSAYRKIGVSRRPQAVLWAVHHDLGPPSAWTS